MYGLPQNFDSSFLVGRTLDMVCFNISQIYLHFDNAVKIVVEGSFAYDADGSANVMHMPVMQSDIMQLLGHKIVKADSDAQGTLRLFFDNSHAFICFDSSKQFESYQIHKGQAVTIV